MATTKRQPPPTPQQIEEIRRLRLVEKREIAEVARLTGFSKGVISRMAATKPLTPENEKIAQRLIAGDSQNAVVRSLDPSGRSIPRNQTRVSQVFRRLVGEGRIQDAGVRQAVAPVVHTTTLDSVLIGSHRDAILAYLAAHAEPLTGRDIAQGLGVSIHKVEAAIDYLRKQGLVAGEKQGKAGHASSARLGTNLSGDHEQWFNVRLTKTVGNGTPSRDASTSLVAAEMQEAHIREGVLKTLALASEPFAELNDLRKAMLDGGFGAAEYYDLTTLLARLETAGLVRLRRDRLGKRTRLKRIAITEAGARQVGVQIHMPVGPRRKTDATDARNHAAVADGGVVERESLAEHAARFPEHGHVITPVAAAPEPEPEAGPSPEPEPVPVQPVAEILAGAWPVLTEIRTRLTRAQARASLLRQAAALAEDDKEREELELYADSASQPTLSTIEREYLAYAEAHE